ncbi:hypothetical protein [Catenulispora subtropica]|uniref:Uncharacterized protein n=1 Tax=Catenulispora subtropica TaxID=450798 RepID=A0ABN2TEJ2_9ACTN
MAQRPMNPGDLWCGQRDALTDLTAFVDGHGPDSEHPLPVLHWKIGLSRTVYARVHAFDREHGGGHRDPREVITAYAEALGTVVEQHPDRDKDFLVVQGRIGPPEGDDELGRTHVVISAEVPVSSRQKTGGKAFVP